jgi:aldehyde:ferredoxin oxidoreductase
MYGYNGKILHVDMTTHTFVVETPDEKFYRKYIGGSGVGAYYLMKETKPGIDPLGPENVMVFSVGPITGAAISGSSRHSVTTKSPLTGALCCSEAGGYWATDFKMSGFDAIVIKGKSPKPVYLWISDGKYEIRDAAKSWGKITGEAQQVIRDELAEPRARVALIGPSGENLNRYACIVNELGHYNGRGGVGAVMGSKNLKAIATKGTMKPEFADLESITAVAKKMVERISDTTTWANAFKQIGTHNCVEANIVGGGLPTRNWTSGNLDGEEELTSTAWNNDFIKPGTCWACAQSCKRSIDPKRTTEIDPAYGGPEYETVGMCGSNLGITNRTAIAKINLVAAKYGMDTISLGGVLGFAMECFERGIITVKDTGGHELRFGNADAAIKVAEMIGKREGIGDILAEGTGIAAKKWNAEEFAVLVKNKEFPAHMPQQKASLGLAYALVANIADHVSSEHDGSICAEPIGPAMRMFDFADAYAPGDLCNEKARFVWVTQIAYSMIDALSICLFTFGIWTVCDYNELITVINASTGWNTNMYEMMQAAERRIHLFRAYDAREGFTAMEDVLPKRLFEPLKGGVLDGFVYDRKAFDQGKDYYYALAGWDPLTGNPSKSKLEEFGLEWCED